MSAASLPDGFFLGQIPPNWNEYVRTLSWEDAHNNRVKVRIPGKHSKGNELPDKDLPWAIVEQSTSSGNLSSSSIGLWGGEWVTGYFLDKDEQIPVITGVLGINTIQDGEIRESIDGSTQLKPVNPYNTGKEATKFQMVGASKPPGPAVLDEENIREGTEGIDKGNKSDAQEEARLAEEKTKAEAARLAAARLAEEKTKAAARLTEDRELLYTNSTTSDLPARQSTREELIARLGLKEVERIEQRAQALRDAGAE